MYPAQGQGMPGVEMYNLNQGAGHPQ